MRFRLLLGLLILPASSCESSKCPATVYEAQGSCSGNAVCNYSGCANPGDTCRCQDGHWSCVTTTCRRDQRLPWPDALARDGQHSEARADDGRLGDARSKDVAPREGGLAEGAACSQSDDRCAAGLKCC